MKTKLIFIFSSLFLLFSCDVDPCDVYCNSGPLSLDFELVDKLSGENIFSNGILNPDDIQVLDIDNDNSSVSFNFISEEEFNILRLGPFGWDIKTANYQIKTDSIQLFRLYVDAQEITEGCCSFVKVNQLRITDADFELNEETGVYKLLIEID